MQVGYEGQPIPSAGAMSLACGTAFLDEDFRGAYVGVGSTLFSRGYACGRCLRIQW